MRQVVFKEKDYLKSVGIFAWKILHKKLVKENFPS